MRFLKLTIYLTIFLLFLSFAKSASAAITIRHLNLGLVGYWDFDGNLNDKSGKSNNAVQSNAISYVAGKFGQAVNFSGSSAAYARVPQSTSLNIAGPFTISYWVYKTSNPSGCCDIPLAKSSCGGSPNYEVDGGDGGAGYEALKILGDGSSPRSPSVTLPLSTWTHIAVEYDGFYLRMFQNGAEILPAVYVGSYTYSNTDDLYLGNLSCTSYNLKGYLDELKIYNRALSSTEITNLYQPGVKIKAPSNMGLVGYWSFNEGTGMRAGDSSGNGKNGTLSGSTAPTWTSGKRGQALSFNGSTAYVDAVNVYDGVKTISFWIKADSTTQKIMNLGGGANVEVSGGTISTTGITSPTIYVDGAVSSTIDTNWHYVTIKTDTGINAGMVMLGKSFDCGDNLTFTYKGGSVTYGTVNVSGQCWMDRNLGASQAATAYNDSASYGDYFQWGRLDDGHQTSNSGTTGTLSSSDDPGHSNFITNSSSTLDWRSPQNNNLWQSVSGYTNNPCPSGWHIPLLSEWSTVITNMSLSSCSSNCLQAMASSALKIPSAGERYIGNGNIFYQGVGGFYWSSSPIGANAYYIDFDNMEVNPGLSTFRGNGYAVRCLKHDAVYFSGKLDEVRIYNRALSSTEITKLYQSGLVKINSSQNNRLTDGLVGMWSFNGADIYGRTAYDRSGSGNNGTLGVGSSAPTPTIGKVGQALNFDENDYVDLSDNSSLSPESGDISISTWVNTNILNSSEHWIWNDYGSQTNNLVILRLNNSNKFEIYFRDGSFNVANAIAPQSLATGTWYNIVAVRNGTTAKIYLNGSLGNSNTNASLGTITTSDGIPPVIGVYFGKTGFFWNGSIDEVRVYNRALSADEVKRLYRMGAADPFICGDILTDARDSKTYATVPIGSQCWMKQGLNVGTRINGAITQDGYSGTTCGTIEKYCYDDTDANCDSNNNPNYPDGGLYQWNQAMCGSTVAGVQGICPTGWHLPTDAEICTLEQAVDASITCGSTGWRGTDGGTKLKPNGASGWEGNLVGNNSGGFGSRTTYGFFWSSSEYDASSAWRRYLRSGYATVARDFNSKTYGFSVRCVKN